MSVRDVAAIALAVALSLLVWSGAAHATGDVFPGRPDAVIDLGTAEGATLVKGQRPPCEPDLPLDP